MRGDLNLNAIRKSDLRMRQIWDFQSGLFYQQTSGVNIKLKKGRNKLLPLCDGRRFISLTNSASCAYNWHLARFF